jgi:hypothetical protein
MAPNTTPDHARDANEGEPELSSLEQEVLDEYAKLAGNLDGVSDDIAEQRMHG